MRLLAVEELVNVIQSVPVARSICRVYPKIVRCAGPIGFHHIDDRATAAQFVGQNVSGHSRPSDQHFRPAEVKISPASAANPPPHIPPPSHPLSGETVPAHRELQGQSRRASLECSEDRSGPGVEPIQENIALHSRW